MTWINSKKRTKKEENISWYVTATGFEPTTT